MLVFHSSQRVFRLIYALTTARICHNAEKFLLQSNTLWSLHRWSLLTAYCVRSYPPRHSSSMSLAFDRNCEFVNFSLFFLMYLNHCSRMSCVGKFDYNLSAIKALYAIDSASPWNALRRLHTLSNRGCRNIALNGILCSSGRINWNTEIKLETRKMSYGWLKWNSQSTISSSQFLTQLQLNQSLHFLHSSFCLSCSLASCFL